VVANIIGVGVIAIVAITVVVMIRCFPGCLTCRYYLHQRGGLGQLGWSTASLGLEEHYGWQAEAIVLGGKDRFDRRAQCWTSNSSKSSGPVTGLGLDEVSNSKSFFNLPLMYFNHIVSWREITIH
jgi:hypothetical protein